MDSMFDEIKRKASTFTDAERRKLMDKLHFLAYSMEDSNHTVHRLAYLHLQTAAAKVGFELGLFKYLAGSEGSLGVEQIAQKTNADEVLLKRYLSYLASVGAINEDGAGLYSANTVTRNLAEDVTVAGISHSFLTIGPQYQALPGFLKSTGYKNPTDELHTVFQTAWKTPQHAFAWFHDKPEELRHFNDYMALRREPELSWLTVYPVEDETRGLSADPQRPVYVNMGGGVGHQCAQFKQRYPDVPGRVVLQDLEHSIAKALPTPGVENLVHNFFEPQPIKGAKFYFLRGVLHNHPDHKVRTVLEHVKAAMAHDSVLLIDEMVLPETGVNAYATSMDLTMMSAFASCERSEPHWRQLIADVGLKLVKLYRYNPVSYESVMDVRLT
ncbi:S-adenosyl-L-methionine-dependent methyltransferase [Xylariaceae sp. FL0804]|nr:S-adenosyl-L-methionine-dependent methyltransferase [Xylariaceae sp. FL0804]